MSSKRQKTAGHEVCTQERHKAERHVSTSTQEIQKEEGHGGVLMGVGRCPHLRQKAAGHGVCTKERQKAEGHGVCTHERQKVEEH